MVDIVVNLVFQDSTLQKYTRRSYMRDHILSGCTSLAERCIVDHPIVRHTQKDISDLGVLDIGSFLLVLQHDYVECRMCYVNAWDLLHLMQLSFKYLKAHPSNLGLFSTTEVLQQVLEEDSSFDSQMDLSKVKTIGRLAEEGCFDVHVPSCRKKFGPHAKSLGRHVEQRLKDHNNRKRDRAIAGKRAFKKLSQGFVPQMLLGEFGLSPDAQNSIDVIASALRRFVEEENSTLHHQLLFPSIIPSGIKQALEGIVAKANVPMEFIQEHWMFLLTLAIMFTPKAKMIKVLGTVLLAFQAINYRAEIVSEVVQIYNMCFGTKAESDWETQMSLKTPIVAALASYLVHHVFGLHDVSYKKISEVVLDFKRGNDVINVTYDVVVDLIKFLLDKIGVMHPDFLKKEHLFPRVEEIGKYIVGLANDLNHGMVPNYDMALKLFEAKKELEGILLSIPNSKEFMEYKKECLVLLNLFAPVVSKFERCSFFHSGSRVAPTGILIGGPTGTGKSTVVPLLLIDIMSRVLEGDELRRFVQNHADFIWDYLPENEFHERYNQQYAVNIEELGQLVDTPGNPDLGAFALIRMLNSANWTLHSAQVNEKGMNHFKSKLVMASTNRTYFDYKSIYSNEAYVRRWDLSVILVPRVEFCKPGFNPDDPWTRRLDMDKIGDYSFESLAAYEFIEYSFHTPESKSYGKSYTYEQFRDLCVAKHLKKQSKGESLLRFQTELKAQALRSRGLDVVKPEESSSVTTISESYSHLVKPLQAVLGGIWNFSQKATSSTLDYFKSWWNTYQLSQWYSSLRTWAKQSAAPAESLIRGLPSKDTCVKIAMYGSIFVLSLGVARYFMHSIVDVQSDVKTRKVKARDVQRSRRANMIFKSRSTGEMHEVKHCDSFSSQFGVVPQHMQETASRIMKRNLYRVKMQKDSTKTGWVLFVANKLAVMPAHFINAFESTDEKNPVLVFTKWGQRETGFSCYLDDINFVYTQEMEQDLVMANFPPVIHDHSNIVPLFRSRQSKELPQRFSGLLLACGNENNLLGSTVVSHEGSIEYTGFELTHCYMYPMATIKGDCGLPLLSCELSGSQSPIIGVHVAGNKVSGLSVPVYREDIEYVMEGLKIKPIVHELKVESIHTQCATGFTALSVQEHYVRPIKTQLVRSEIYGAKTEGAFFPALLSSKIVEGKRVDPWENCHRAYSPIHGVIPSATLSKALDIVKHKVLSIYEPLSVFKSTYDFDTAVKGDGSKSFGPIPRSTSCGHPMQQRLKSRGKTAIFGSVGDYTMDTELCQELRERVKECEDKLKQRIRPEFHFQDFIKDEKLKAEKVKVGRSRLVSGSSLEYLILCRMYFGAFVKYMIEHRIDNGSLCGVNPYGLEWTKVVARLLRKGGKGFFGDFKHFDATVSPQVAWAVFEIIKAFYGDLDEVSNTIREMLFEDLVNPIHVMSEDGKTYTVEWLGSNSSGNFLTTMINTLVNMVLLTSAFVELMPSDYSMLDHVDFEVYGDDNAVAVSEKVSLLYNLDTVSKCLALWGFEYTTEMKDGSIYDVKNITDGSILKRGFRFNVETRLWDAPLNVASLKEMLNWRHKNTTRDEFNQVVNTYYAESALHGREEFKELTSGLATLCHDKLGYWPLYTSYEGAHSFATGRDEYL